MKGRTYICIDLKSFYASVECVERGLDPFTTNLAVADPTRGSGSICLAITPAMKALGVKNRCRVFEIPKNIRYITAMPQMRKYMQVSADIYGIYLDYISPDDIHVYSIDECFIDVTDYLSIYGKTPREMAKLLMDAVLDGTGISAAAGIGTNLFLAKIALDITAKHAEDRIGILDEVSFREKIWHHMPITDIWGIGPGTAKRLEKFGIFDLHGITLVDKKILLKEFGINAEYLIDHANGREPCTIKEIKEYRPESTSIFHSQVLFEDYSYDDALVILREMVDSQTMKLLEEHLVTDMLSLTVSYSGGMIRSTGGSRRIGEYTNSFRKLIGYFEEIYYETTDREHGIRRISIGLGDLQDDSMESLSLFSDPEEDMKEKKLRTALSEIQLRYGRNAILKGTSYKDKATARSRNKMVGGHNGG